MTYGQWLRDKRREMGLTQKDVESRTGVGENALSKIENDRRQPTVETRQEIHRVLGTNEYELASLGILEEIGSSGRYDWPRRSSDPHSDGSVILTRHEAIGQIREAAGNMRWTQSMVDSIVQQVRLFKELQGK